MRRVLMVFYYFPPMAGIGSIRALKFAQYLPEFGWEPTILTPRTRPARSADPSLKIERVVRTSSLELSRVGRRALGLEGGQAPARVGTVLVQLQRFVRRWLYRPDAQIGWYPFAVQTGRQILRRQRFDAIFSSAFPITAHLVAERLKQDSQLPWVAEFRDPWTQRLEYDSSARRRMDEQTERRILQGATAVVTVSRHLADLFMAAGARRVYTLTNGFDPTDFPAQVRRRGRSACYLGSYYPQEQDLKTALEGIAMACANDSHGDLLVRFVGEPTAQITALVKQCGLRDRAEFTGFVSHHESLRHLSESTFLILAGTSLSARRNPVLLGLLPAKMFEYLGARRPILYVGDLNGEAAALLRETGGASLVEAGDVGGVCRAIPSLLAEWKPLDDACLVRFTRREIAKGLSRVLDEVTQERE